jgi:MarR family transcriptional regulator, 2-MHQ and catechol-resistance regulon repressor
MIMSSESSPAGTPSEDPPGTVDPQFADVLKLFTVLYRANAALQDESRRSIRRHGLTPAEFAVLEVLYHRGPLLLGEIQGKILVSSGGITYLVDRLHARGLVERRECPEDRRARYAALTQEGVRFMDDIFPGHARCLARASEGLSPEERRQAIALLKALGKGAAAAPRCDEDGGTPEVPGTLDDGPPPYLP